MQPDAGRLPAPRLPDAQLALHDRRGKEWTQDEEEGERCLPARLLACLPVCSPDARKRDVIDL